MRNDSENDFLTWIIQAMTSFRIDPTFVTPLNIEHRADRRSSLWDHSTNSIPFL